MMLFKEKYKAANHHIQVPDTARILTLEKIDGLDNAVSKSEKNSTMWFRYIISAILLVIVLAVGLPQAISSPVDSGKSLDGTVGETLLEDTIQQHQSLSVQVPKEDLAVSESTMQPPAIQPEEGRSAEVPKTAVTTEAFSEMPVIAPAQSDALESFPFYPEDKEDEPDTSIKTMTVNSLPYLAISEPVFPKKMTYAESRRWYTMEQASDYDPVFSASLETFSYQSASQILQKGNGLKNQMYSPVSLYMAMGMLTESASGQTRTEIMNAFHIKSLNTFRNNLNNLYKKLYMDNEVGQLKMANSVWLANGFPFSTQTLNTLADSYYAGTYSVDFTVPDTVKKIDSWISSNTGGMLGYTDTPATNTAMLLFNTLYFKDEWNLDISEENTKMSDFTRSDGSIVQANFMNLVNTLNYSINNVYSATSLRFKNGCTMRLILPQDGISTGDIIKNSNLLQSALTPGNNYGDVSLKLPKFDFADDRNLVEDLKQMGINSAFDEKTADFSNLSSFKPLWVDVVKQKTAISLDEKGCKAAAFTQVGILAGEGAPPKITIDLNFNKPFVFAILSPDQLPLFIGTVNDPTLK